MTQSPQERSADDESAAQAAVEQQLEELGDDPLVILKRVSAERFAQCVRDEHPRTIAVALDCLPPARVAELLGKLPPEICPEVVKELGKGVKVLPQIQSSLIGALSRKIREMPVEKPREDDHLKRLAEVVRAADRKQRRMLVDAIREQDEATAQRLMDLLYRFEDLMSLEDRAIQQILGQVDVSTLAAAMMGADATISDRVLKNLSRRAADMLKEELQFAGRTPASRVEQARDAIGKLIAKTEQEAE
jgi:flagellar motor switch protein FliG